MARKKQGYLPDMEPPSVAEIDTAADEYVEVRDQRMLLTTEEAEKKDILRGLMVAHNLKTYEYDGKVVMLNTEPSVKVKKLKAPKEKDDDE